MQKNKFLSKKNPSELTVYNISQDQASVSVNLNANITHCIITLLMGINFLRISIKKAAHCIYNTFFC